MLNGALFKNLMYKTNKKFWLRNVGGRIFGRNLDNLNHVVEKVFMVIKLRLVVDDVGGKSDVVDKFICLFTRKCSIRLQARYVVSLCDIILPVTVIEGWRITGVPGYI